MLSTLTRGCGSWTGDLEAAGETANQKPVLLTRLSGEDTKFLEKSVNIPLRVKSAIGSAVTKTPSAPSVPSAVSLADAIKAKTPKTQYSRPKSVCSNSQGPEASREKILRSTSAASIFVQKSKSDLATSTPRLNKASSSAVFSKYRTKFKDSDQLTRDKEAEIKRSSSSVVKVQRPDGQIELPKTYMTRKGALVLFTAPENLTFSEPDQKCYYKKGQDENDVGRLSLTLGTVNKLTTSVLRYGSQQQPEDEVDSDDGAQREETHMQFIRDDQADQEVIDYRAQPGADFVFYLRDMQSRAVVRNLVRTPSQQSLASVDSTAELTAALHSIDPTGSFEVRGSISPDVKRLAGGSQRWNVSSAGSIRSHSRYAMSRPSTSASGRSTSLSVEQLAASLKSSPYLGHPIKPPYPPNSGNYPPSPETCPRHGSARSRNSGSVGPGSAHSLTSARSRDASSAHSVRSQRSSLGRGSRLNHVELDSASHGSIVNLTVQEGDGSERARSAALLRDGSLLMVDDESYHGDSVRSGGLSPGQHQQWLQDSSCLSEADLAIDNDVVTDGMSRHEATSPNPDGEWTQEQQAHSPVRYYDSRPTSTASRHTYISATTSLPTTIEDGQLNPNTLLLDDQLDQDMLLVDHNALLLDHPSGQEDLLDAFQESANGDQWPADGGQERQSPALSARLESLSADRPSSSQANSLSQRPHTASPSVLDSSARSLGEAQAGVGEQSAGADDIFVSSTVDTEMVSSAAKGLSPTSSDRIETMESQAEEISPTEDAVQGRRSTIPAASSPRAHSPAPRLPLRAVGLADVVNKLGVPHTTLVPPKLGPSGYETAKTGSSTVRQSPSPDIMVTSDTKKPPAPSKQISKLDLGKLKMMVKPPAAKSSSPRTGRRSKSKSVRPKSTGVQFIDSMNIDNYQGPSEDEVEKLVEEELSKELESSQLTEGEESIPFLVVPEEKADDAVSLATDDEALEEELKKQAEPGKKKSKKSLAKEKAALREARRQEKLRREEELKALEEKKKQREKDKRREKIAEQRRIQMAKEELEDAAQEAKRAAEAEEEARQMLQDSRRLAREEREARRNAEAEKKKQEKERQRLERRKMEEAARLREQEMAERLAGAAEKRRLREGAEWERQERERLEQEEREQEEEEDRQRLEEEEERIRELEREAEEEAITRLVKEREDAESRMRQAREEASKQCQEEERLRLEEKKRKAEEEECQRQLEEDVERKRQEDLARIRRIQKLEEEARERVKRELARRRTWAIRRRELNQAQRDHLNAMRQTQGMTRPWLFSYYVHWPKENYERRVFVAKKKKFRPRPKPKPDTEAQGKP